MSFSTKLKDRIEHLAQVTAKKVAESVGFEAADDTIVEQRIQICNSCDRLFKPTRNCKLCGCFIDLKVKSKLSSCPINKW